MSYSPGQKMVAIKSDWQGQLWKEGDVFTLLKDFGAPRGLLFVEIVPPPFYISFAREYFRPIVERKTDISIFTKILDDVRQREPAL